MLTLYDGNEFAGKNKYTYKDTTMSIKHYPILDAKKIAEHYTKQDGVPVSYVCTTALNEGVKAVDVFYRATPHPEFGNRYFALYHLDGKSHPFITRADMIEDFDFAVVEGDDGMLHYSQHRWNYLSFDNGNMIDGGRAYIRSSRDTRMFKVKDGVFVENLDRGNR
jgi:hypothetical protein